MGIREPFGGMKVPVLLSNAIPSGSGIIPCDVYLTLWDTREKLLFPGNHTARNGAVPNFFITRANENRFKKIPF